MNLNHETKYRLQSQNHTLIALTPKGNGLFSEDGEEVSSDAEAAAGEEQVGDSGNSDYRAYQYEIDECIA